MSKLFLKKVVIFALLTFSSSEVEASRLVHRISDNTQNATAASEIQSMIKDNYDTAEALEAPTNIFRAITEKAERLELAE